MLSYSIISDSSGDCLPISCLILSFLIYFFSQSSIQPSSLLNHFLSQPNPNPIPPVLPTSLRPYFIWLSSSSCYLNQHWCSKGNKLQSSWTTDIIYNHFLHRNMYFISYICSQSKFYYDFIARESKHIQVLSQIPTPHYDTFNLF